MSSITQVQIADLDLNYSSPSLNLPVTGAGDGGEPQGYLSAGNSRRKFITACAAAAAAPGPGTGTAAAVPQSGIRLPKAGRTHGASPHHPSPAHTRGVEGLQAPGVPAPLPAGAQRGHELSPGPCATAETEWHPKETRNTSIKPISKLK